MLSLFDILKSMSVHPNVLLELFGCYRHFRHPTVDEPEGIKALRDNSMLELPLDELCLRKMSGAFNRTFILEFIRKHRRWPRVSITDDRLSHDLQKLLISKPLGFQNMI